MVTRTGITGPPWRLVRRVLRHVVRTVLVLLGLVGILLLTFLLPPVRGALLGAGLRLADGALPGTLTAGRTVWPRAGRVVLEDLVWLSDTADTLAVVPRLELAVSLPALRTHDLVVDSLLLDIRVTDIPRIQAAFPAAVSDTAVTTTADTGETPGVPWLRAGAVEGIPSVVVHGLDLRVRRAVVAPGLTVHGVRLQGQVDAGSGGSAARVDLTARLAADLSDSTPVFLELERLELAAQYGPRTGRFGLESLVAVGVVGPVARREVLRGAGPVSLQLTGEGRFDFESSSHPFDAALAGHLAGPLADLFGDDWPGSLPAGDFSRCAVTFNVEAAGSPSGTIDGGVTLELDECDGLQRGRLRLRAQVEPAHPAGLRAQLDTLDLAVPGCNLAARGALADSTVELALAATAQGPIPLLALAGLQPATTDLTLKLDLQVSGPRRFPSGELHLSGNFRDEQWDATDVDFNVVGGLEGLTARLRSGRLHKDGVALLDTLACDVDYTPQESLPLVVAFLAGRDASRIVALVSGGADTVATVRLDSLQLAAAGQMIRLEAPVTVRIDTAGGEYSLDEMVLAGAPGRIHLAGTFRDGEMDMTAGTDLLFTEDMLNSLVPSEIWSRDGGVDLTVQGDVALGGTPADPVFRGGVEVTLRPHRDRPRVGVMISLHLNEGDESGLSADVRIAANDTVLLRASAFAPGSMDLENGIWRPDPTGEMELVVEEQRLGLAHFKPFLPDEVAARGSLVLAADIRVPLGEPRPVTASLESGRLEARLEAAGLDIDLPNGSSLVLDMACRGEGTLRDPRLVGEVTVGSGFLRIPELPRSLHPVEGRVYLWEVALKDSAALAASVGQDVARRWQPDQEVVESVAFMPDLDLKIRLPGNLRLHGYGLDTEVIGEVDVSRGFDKKGLPGPALRGEIGMVRGNLRFMNRQFKIERGSVLFTGAVPPNPELDLLMRSQIGSYTVSVAVTGRADEPVVDLTSEPDLEKTDVVAVLFFGRPLNDLDADERGRVGDENDPGKQLQENLAGLAMVFGTKGLQDSMTSSFGVDMVEFGSDSSGDATFAAGKYLNPDMLLKYHQSLEKSGTYFMTLEYILSRAFRVVSTYGQGEESSGLELQWERRY